MIGLQIDQAIHSVSEKSAHVGRALIHGAGRSRVEKPPMLHSIYVGISDARGTRVRWSEPVQRKWP